MFKNPLVVGYKGEIGSYILQGLLKVMPKASNIWCFDINDTEVDKIIRIKKADYIFLCVPLYQTKKWLLTYKKFLKNKIVVEQCSLKSFLLDDELKGISFMHMHILFRPSVTPNKNDRSCIVLNGGFSNFLFAKKMEKILDIDRIDQINWNAKEHDIEMAKQQALVHKILLVLDKIANPSGPSTYMVKKIHELAERIKAGDKKLYCVIQNNNHTYDITNKFKDELGKFDITEYMK